MKIKISSTQYRGRMERLDFSRQWKLKSFQLCSKLPHFCNFILFQSKYQRLFINRFVKLEYKAVNSLDEACRVFEEQTMKKEDNQFVEGLMFNLNRGVIMTGNMVNSAEPGKVYIT